MSDVVTGTYTVEYEPKDAGDHRIEVTLKNKPIKDAPFKVKVKEGMFQEGTVEFSPSGADEGNSFIESYTFTIRARTKKNTNKKDGGDDFKVNIVGPAGEVQGVVIKDLGDGTYLVSYKLPEAGEYTINVTLNGKHIQGSPWKMHN